MSSIERMAEAMYDNNLIQLEAVKQNRADRLGYTRHPGSQLPFAQALPHVRKVWIEFAMAALDPLTAPPSAEMGEFIMRETGLGPLTSGQAIEAFVRGLKEGK